MTADEEGCSEAVPVLASEKTQAAWRVLTTVLDPEVPVLSVCDLGIVRSVIEQEEGLEVVLTPTYSGCPAAEAIAQSVRDALLRARLGPVHVRMRLAPAWTTEWISEAGKQKLRDHGIAPPGRVSAATSIRFVPHLDCPHCASRRTERLSAFGATACKALYRCLDCREPFEHFKPI